MKDQGGHRRITSAHGIALVALFVALSGIAYASVAKNSVKSKHIVNGQVKNADVKNQGLKGTRLKDDTVTGTQIDEDTLATVGNSDTVDGLHARRIRFAAAADTATTEVLSLGHLTIEASCSAGGAISVLFKTDRNNSFLHVGSIGAGGSVYNENDDLDVGESLALTLTDGASGSFTFYSPAGFSPLTQPGHTISGTYLSEIGGSVQCLFAGTVLGSTPSGIGIGFPREAARGADKFEEATPRANPGPNNDG